MSHRQLPSRRGDATPARPTSAKSTSSFKRWPAISSRRYPQACSQAAFISMKRSPLARPIDGWRRQSVAPALGGHFIEAPAKGLVAGRAPNHRRSSSAPQFPIMAKLMSDLCAAPVTQHPKPLAARNRCNGYTDGWQNGLLGRCRRAPPGIPATGLEPHTGRGIRAGHHLASRQRHGTEIPPRRPVRASSADLQRRGGQRGRRPARRRPVVGAPRPAVRPGTSYCRTSPTSSAIP